MSAPLLEQKEPTARLVEVFSSIQGEAELIGVRQIFVRFFGCNLRCAWCDSPETLTAPKGPLQPARIETQPGSAQFRAIPNRTSIHDVLDAILALNTVPHHSVSLTGGEPLLHWRFLQELLPALQRHGLTRYLETNGLLPEPLERVVDQVDWIAMDLKPPSCTGDPFPDWLHRHRAFLEVIRGADRPPRLFLKLIIGASADQGEMEAAFRLASELAPDSSMTLQPVTPFGSVTETPTMEAMLAWHALASRHGREVRVLPQLHKLMRVL